MSLKKPRVLIVEDVPALAESYAAFLADEAVTVDIALTGQAALASIERQPAAVARATAHQLRGLFGQFGARPAAEAAGLVEGSEAADMPDRIAVLRAEANSAVAALEKVGRSA